MKTILILSLLIFSKILNAQNIDMGNKFNIVDAITEQPIPYVSIILPDAKLAITAQENGVFYIPGKLNAMLDTISFSAQNYTTLKVPINQLAHTGIVKLAKASRKPIVANSEYLGKLTLNEYLSEDVSYYAGVSSDDSQFDYLQIAQRFNTNSLNCRLTQINMTKVRDWLTTKFRVRIYDIDSLSGGPGSDLCDQILDQDNGLDVEAYLSGSFSTDYRDSEVKIDLRKYNVIIPQKAFYIAIEYLRDVSNASQAPVYNKKTNQMNTSLVFRPFMGISPITGIELNIWVMELNRIWKTYDHFLPFGTDLAIKATIEY